jgi:hypothetical protein
VFDATPRLRFALLRDYHPQFFPADLAFLVFGTFILWRIFTSLHNLSAKLSATKKFAFHMFD